jgi:hypothetical protein
MVRLSHISFFFLKTIYLSPINNPLFYCQLMVAGMFLMGGALKKHEAVAFLLLSALSHRLMPAIHIYNRNTDTTRNNIISQNIRFFPVKKGIVFSAIVFAGIFYISIPLSLYCYAGIHFETPPSTASICRTEFKTIRTPSGEPLSFVEGIAISRHQFRIPISPSLLFGHLASETIFLRERVSDSLIRKVCPVNKISPEDVFSGKAVYTQPEFESPFLEEIHHQNIVHLLLLALFAFVFFFYDGMCIFQKRPDTVFLKRIFLTMDFILYSSYIFLWCILIMDIFLPESQTAWVTSHIFPSEHSFTTIVAITIIICIVRIIGSIGNIETAGRTIR